MPISIQCPAPRIAFPPSLGGVYRWTVLAGLLLLPAPAFAFCGAMVGGPGEELYNHTDEIVLVYDGQTETVNIRVDYSGTSTRFGMVIPVPVVLKREQVKTIESGYFDLLRKFTQPRMVEYSHAAAEGQVCVPACRSGRDHGSSFGCGAEDSASAPFSDTDATDGLADADGFDYGVTIEDEFAAGDYQIVLLSAEQSRGLFLWFQDNGYAMPPEAIPRLQEYMDLGMYFMGVKVGLRPDTRRSLTQPTTLQPLQIRFPSTQAMLPVRLGSVNMQQGVGQEVMLYILHPTGVARAANWRTVDLLGDFGIHPAVEPQFTQFIQSLFSAQVALENDPANTLIREFYWRLPVEPRVIQPTGYHCDPCMPEVILPVYEPIPY